MTAGGSKVGSMSYMTTDTHRQLMACRDHVYAALIAAARYRHEFSDWEGRERLAVTLAANEWAIAHGMAPITVTDVLDVEQRAVGHSDYAPKLALYVAERVFGPIITPETP